MQTTTQVICAKRIITMNDEQPFANAVAIRDGKILSVGELDEIIYWLNRSPFLPYEIVDTFKDKVLMPGLIDAHTHPAILAIEYANHFVAQVPWSKPDGGFFQTYGTKEEVLNRLKELDATLPEGEVLWAVHYDDNQAGGFLYRTELDTVSRTRPIFVSDKVFHRFWGNSALFEQAGISLEPNATKLEGIELDENNVPNGTMIEMRGSTHVMPVLHKQMTMTEEKLKNILPLFISQGVTTATELALGGINTKGIEDDVRQFTNVFGDGTEGLSIIGIPFYSNLKHALGSFEAVYDKLLTLKQDKDNHFQVSGVKLYLDGSIIAHTAPLGWPGYWDGSSGQHNQGDPQEIREAIIKFHQVGMQTITHTNSALACQVVIDAIEEAQALCSRPDIRHRMEHCYGITEAQLRKCSTLNISVQFFSSQIYYYGDNHLEVQGLNRGGHQLLPIKTADRLGVSWGMHVDPPGTPQLPWVAMWAAVTRESLQGKTIGLNQAVSRESVLRAFTLEHAWQHHLDHEIGSIELGKKANFCVLEEDPLTIPIDQFKNMPVWGTISEGVPHKANNVG